ncbi:MAG: hypothetical protein EZS28_003584 [Streblomastix strix]|uniref:Uncharacterized protein n=1 Tax=Streblomastix strix TaxID=222440 RepID=A0A5J4X113_9EUKA|nr:MAG: hypothetical protein EZS28_003584 [Streblomastix strix]
MQHSDYVAGYMQLGEILKTLTIHAESFSISEQQFTDQLVTELTSGGVKYTRAPLGARGLATCTMVQTCQVNWTITIPGNTLVIQLNETNLEDGEYNKRINFNGLEDSQALVAKSMTQAEQKYYGKTAEREEKSEQLRFWLGFSTAWQPFHQFQLMRDATALWGTSIYAREQAAISSNSLSDLCTSNSVSVSQLGSIINGKRHCGIFIEIHLSDIDTQSVTTPLYFKIPFDITFSGVLDLNQLNPIFNSFPVLTRNYVQLHLQPWIQDYLQDLKVVWLNKTDAVKNKHQAYHMIPPEKLDIVYLLAEPTAQAVFAYKKFNVRIVNMQNTALCDRLPQNSISQINNARFEKLEIQNISFNVENEDAIINMIREQKIVNFPTQVFRFQSSNFPFSGFESSGAMQSIMSFSNIKSLFMTFGMSLYPTWFYPILLNDFDLVCDQRHVIPAPYEALTQTANGLMFDYIVDQDVVSAPSDLYHSLTFENFYCTDKTGGFYGKDNVNIFHTSTLFVGTKASKTLYPNKYMLAWKFATVDSFMRGYNSSKLCARTNIQVILHGNLTKVILDNTDSNKEQNQNDLNQFIAMRSYLDPTKASITPMMHYLCDAFMRITFDNNPNPQVLNIDVIGELAGSAINAV